MSVGQTRDWNAQRGVENGECKAAEKADFCAA
jgi:hypothetical protein